MLGDATGKVKGLKFHGFFEHREPHGDIRRAGFTRPGKFYRSLGRTIMRLQSGKKSPRRQFWRQASAWEKGRREGTR